MRWAFGCLTLQHEM